MSELIETTNKLKKEITTLEGEENFEKARKIEKEYLELRAKLLDMIDSSTRRAKSIDFNDFLEQLENEPEVPKVYTGIPLLDAYLEQEITDEKGRVIDRRYGLGGHSNLIILAGVSGAGKTNFFMRLISFLSRKNKVAFFNFEMGKMKARDNLLKYRAIMNSKNIKIYLGDRSLDEIKIEIKLLSAMGVRHIAIDSIMNIEVKGIHTSKEVDSWKYISKELSKLASQLEINIYLIAQVSQTTEKEGGLYLKNGNALQYMADYVMFLSKEKIMATPQRPKKDPQTGNFIYREDARLLSIIKNRIDEKNFTITIPKRMVEDRTVYTDDEYELKVKRIASVVRKKREDESSEAVEVVYEMPKT
jgi:replicative DNA helicase